MGLGGSRLAAVLRTDIREIQGQGMLAGVTWEGPKDGTRIWIVESGGGFHISMKEREWGCWRLYEMPPAQACCVV